MNMFNQRNVGLEGFEPTTDRCLKNPLLPDYSFIARCKSGKQILKFMSRSLLAGWFPIPSGLFHFETNVSQFYQAELQALTHSPSFFQRAQINLFDTVLLFALRFRPVLNEKPKKKGNLKGISPFGLRKEKLENPARSILSNSPEYSISGKDVRETNDEQKKRRPSVSCSK